MKNKLLNKVRTREDLLRAVIVTIMAIIFIFGFALIIISNKVDFPTLTGKAIAEEKSDILNEYNKCVSGGSHGLMYYLLGFGGKNYYYDFNERKCKECSIYTSCSDYDNIEYGKYQCLSDYKDPCHIGCYFDFVCKEIPDRVYGIRPNFAVNINYEISEYDEIIKNVKNLVSTCQDSENLEDCVMKKISEFSNDKLKWDIEKKKGKEAVFYGISDFINHCTNSIDKECICEYDSNEFVVIEIDIDNELNFITLQSGEMIDNIEKRFDPLSSIPEIISYTHGDFALKYPDSTKAYEKLVIYKDKEGRYDFVEIDGANIKTRDGRIIEKVEKPCSYPKNYFIFSITSKQKLLVYEDGSLKNKPVVYKVGVRLEEKPHETDIIAESMPKSENSAIIMFKPVDGEKNYDLYLSDSDITSLEKAAKIASVNIDSYAELKGLNIFDSKWEMSGALERVKFKTELGYMGVEANVLYKISDDKYAYIYDGLQAGKTYYFALAKQGTGEFKKIPVSIKDDLEPQPARITEVRRVGDQVEITWERPLFNRDGSNAIMDSTIGYKYSIYCSKDKPTNIASMKLLKGFIQSKTETTTEKVAIHDSCTEPSYFLVITYDQSNNPKDNGSSFSEISFTHSFIK